MSKLLVGLLVFAASLVVILFVLLAGRSALRVALRGPFGRLVLRPLYSITLRPVVWLLRRLGRLIRGPVRSEAQLGAASYNAIVRVIGGTTLAEEALGEVPQATRKLVRRQGRFFRSANANKAVDGLAVSLSLADAKRNLDSAKKYYEEPMGQETRPTILYEDSEEALIIGILRDVDQPFFYVMRRISRNVSRNVLKLISLMTFFLSIFPFVIAVLNPWVKPTQDAAGIIVYAVICIAFFLLLNQLRLYYSIATRNNGQNFNYFIQTYFGRLLSQHKSAATSFADVRNNSDDPLDMVQDEANVWFLNLHWLSARQWFLQLYVRNMTFQIARNLWLSYFVVPLLLIVAFGVYYGLTVAGLIPGLSDIEAKLPTMQRWTAVAAGAAVLAPSLLLLIFYFRQLQGLLEEFQGQITPEGALGFRSMDVNGVIESNVGPVVREVVARRRNPLQPVTLPQQSSPLLQNPSAAGLSTGR